MRLALAFCVFVSVATPAVAQTQKGLWGCTTGSKSDAHQRWNQKTRPKPTSLSPAKGTSVSDMIALDVPQTYKKTYTSPVPGEERLFKLKGFVQLIKQSDDDCDLHLEISEGPKTKDRVIIEIPAKSTKTQEAAAKMFNLSETAKAHKYTTAPQQIEVVGYAFVDLSHMCKNDAKAGCQHGSADVATVWEVHPVFTIKWAK